MADFVPNYAAENANNTYEQVQDISGMFVMPSKFPVFRLADDYAHKPTAVCRPYVFQTLTWNPASTQESQLTPFEDGAFFFRNILRAMVYLIQTTSATPSFQYTAVFDPSSGGLYDQQQLQAQGETVLLPQYFQANPSFSANMPTPHGPYLYCGQGLQRTGFWLDALTSYAASVNVLFSGVPTSDIDGVLLRWNVSSWKPVKTGQAGATVDGVYQINFTNILQSGYYAVVCDAQTHLTGTVPTAAMNFVVTSPSVWAHLPSGVTNDFANVIEGYRVSSYDILCSCLASDLNASGQIIAAQLNKGTDWYLTYCSSNTLFGVLSGLNQMEPLVAKTGLFMFAKPSDRKDFRMQEDISKAAGTSSAATTVFPLRNPSDYLGLCIKTQDTSSGNFQIKLTQALEFQTSSQGWDLVPPAANQEAFQYSMQAVGMMQQFFTNAFHWTSIFKTIRNIASMAPPIIAAFTPFLPPQAQAIGTIAALALGGVAKGAEFFEGLTRSEVSTSAPSLANFGVNRMLEQGRAGGFTGGDASAGMEERY